LNIERGDSYGVKMEKTSFGSIVIDGRRYNHDVIVYNDGEIENRYKDFSGSSHSVSRAEIEKVTRGNPRTVIIGTGQGGLLSLSEAARDYLRQNNIKVIECPAPEAINQYNLAEEPKCALIHVTC